MSSRSKMHYQRMMKKKKKNGEKERLMLVSEILNSK